MAYRIMSQNGKDQYSLTEFVVDIEGDVASLPTDVAPGSAALIVSTSDVYILNTEKEWKKI